MYIPFQLYSLNIFLDIKEASSLYNRGRNLFHFHPPTPQIQILPLDHEVGWETSWYFITCLLLERTFPVTSSNYWGCLADNSHSMQRVKTRVSILFQEHQGSPLTSRVSSMVNNLFWKQCIIPWVKGHWKETETKDTALSCPEYLIWGADVFLQTDHPCILFSKY